MAHNETPTKGTIMPKFNVKNPYVKTVVIVTTTVVLNVVAIKIAQKIAEKDA